MKNKLVVRLTIMMLSFMGMMLVNKTDYYAFPAISVEFDGGEESVIVSGIPEKDANGDWYQIRGYLNYQGERVETFCYAPYVYPYHVPDRQAYIFNWKDIEFILPCSGEYQFTTYLTKLVGNDEIAGPKTTITIYLTKQDESTNWGPGLPNTTVGKDLLENIQGTDESWRIEEDIYNWSLNGQDIITVPDQNVSLKVTTDSPDFPTEGIKDFFGYHMTIKFSIDHDGELGFTATLEYMVGKEYAGMYANLFYVVGDGNFEFVESSLVDEEGYASFYFTHASDYIIVITDEPYEGQDLNPQAEESTERVDTEDALDVSGNVNQGAGSGDSAVGVQDTQDGNSTSSSSILIFVVGGIAIAAVGIIFVLKKNKK